MPIYRVDDAQVRDSVTGELLRELVGQAVQIVHRDTTNPAAILDSTGSAIPGSTLVVTPVFTTPTFWVDVTDPTGLFLDWRDPNTGVRGPVNFEAALRAEAAQVQAVVGMLPRQVHAGTDMTTVRPVWAGPVHWIVAMDAVPINLAAGDLVIRADLVPASVGVA